MLLVQSTYLPYIEFFTSACVQKIENHDCLSVFIFKKNIVEYDMCDHLREKSLNISVVAWIWQRG